MGVPVVKNTRILAASLAAVNLCLIAFAMCNPYKSDSFLIQKLQLKCLDKTKVDVLDVLKLRAGIWDSGDDNVKLHKWLLCILVHYGLMTPRGVFRLDNALARTPKHKQDELEDKIDSCLSRNRTNPHNKAWIYLKCLNKNSTELILL